MAGRLYCGLLDAVFVRGLELKTAGRLCCAFRGALFADVVGSWEYATFLVIGSITAPFFLSSVRSDPLLPNTDMNEGNAPGMRELVCIGMLDDREIEVDLRLIGQEKG